jgi:hypothetical protein
MLDVQKLIEGVHEYIARAINPLSERVKALESRQPEKGDKGENGQDGKSVTIDEVLPQLEQTIIETVKSIPIPKDGEAGKDADEDAIIEKVMSRIVTPKDGMDGADGKDADESAIAKSVIDTLSDSNTFTSKLVDAVVKMIPAPKDGKDGFDGKDGERGENGIDGRDGINGKDADEDAIVERVLALIPTPKDGENGRDGVDGANGKDGSNGIDGKDGSNGLDGKDGADGKDGIDGKSITLEDVAPILESAISKYALEFERRAYDVLQKAVDALPKPKDGEKGEKGADGFGVEKFEQRGEREVVAIYRNGDEVIEQSFKFPALIYRGVYKQGQFENGDAVTYAGSLWIANKDTEAVPGSNADWKLAVKRGRDGKDKE